MTILKAMMLGVLTMAVVVGLVYGLEWASHLWPTQTFLGVVAALTALVMLVWYVTITERR